MRKVVLGLDLGEKRTGIAVGDTEVRLASPLETFEGQPGKAFASRLKDIADEYCAKTIVVGLPLCMSGEEGSAVQRIRSKVEWLKTIIDGMEWVFVDERLTSANAENLLQEQGVRRDLRKGLRDQLAAQQILQTYLNGLR